MLQCIRVSVILDKALILDAVDFSINVGEFVGIIGPNGAGKSTLVKVMAGIRKPELGTVKIHGADIGSMSRQEISRELAMVAQEENLEFGFTVLEYVSFGRAPHHGGIFFENDHDREIVRSALSGTMTDGLANRQVESLSGGERQRVRIARALAQQPKILILDEPTNHLDLYSQMNLIELLQHINKQGIAIVMVSHDINFMCLACDHLRLMSEGRIIKEGRSEEVITESLLAQAFRVRVFVDRNPLTMAPRITPVEKI